MFRADILHDSAGILQTPDEKERELLNGAKGGGHGVHDGDGDKETSRNAAPAVSDTAQPPKPFQGFELRRTVVRRFIPRNRNLDCELDQTCHFYDSNTTVRSPGSGDHQQESNHHHDHHDHQINRESHLVVYTPHVSTQDGLPWYHPAVRAIAFLYESDAPHGHDTQDKGYGTLSLHFLPFSSNQIPDEIEIPHRLERTLLGLMSTQLRLIRGTSQEPLLRGQPKPYKDNIIPQHVLQNTYMRLKEQYAVYLIANWVESTESSKHVFEDINIAAFLIELWRLMYNDMDADDGEPQQHSFPGFVDIACGNGVLVHILRSEGYEGWGFDARRRKTWSTFPASTQKHLKEAICIPRPFKDALDAREQNSEEPIDLSSTEILSGIFEKDTFIISNHADELTVWTPLLGMLSNPSRPLPFIAIPCCSHALSGARNRYPPPKTSTKKTKQRESPQSPATSSAATTSQPHENTSQAQVQDQDHDHDHDHEQQNPNPNPNPQPATGDLKVLRDCKQKAQQDPASSSSAYGCLTAKVVSVAEEVGYGYDVEKTLLRIPSTRNMGVIGGLKTWTRTSFSRDKAETRLDTTDACEGADYGSRADERARNVVEKESIRDGGVGEAASLWVERSLGLQKTKGKGKIKGGAQHG